MIFFKIVIINFWYIFMQYKEPILKKNISQKVCLQGDKRLKLLIHAEPGFLTIRSNRLYPSLLYRLQVIFLSALFDNIDIDKKKDKKIFIYAVRGGGGRERILKDSVKKNNLSSVLLKKNTQSSITNKALHIQHYVTLPKVKS